MMKDECSRCLRLHEFANKLPRLAFPFNKKDVPLNGIYLMFEKGESAHGFDRIVRVGTHTGANQLPSRLKQHFENENKDRSIFRKNIGRCLLNKAKDPFLSQWELDLTTKSAREKYGSKIDFKKQIETEKKVTSRLRQNFSFVLLPVEEKKERLELESKMIAALSLCPQCAPSKSWLGSFSPKEKIRESGLWQVNELNKTPLSDADIEALRAKAAPKF